ncbi:hypothetical protein DLM75_21710 [Leptospira stimsonii]|uniref:Uncharacterized protein n=1 Tax=Leptospira stimsonii TaxID=2202203 RepID=A0A396YUE5_9LEPT|nr:hypothetical protein DLM75_21710 [Leptospira stimsonii]
MNFFRIEWLDIEDSLFLSSRFEFLHRKYFIRNRFPFVTTKGSIRISKRFLFIPKMNVGLSLIYQIFRVALC